MDLLFGALFLYAAYYFRRHYQSPAEASRQDIRRMALIIMIYSGVYGAYNIWLGFGGAPFGGFGM